MINVVNKQNFSNHVNIELMLDDADDLFQRIKSFHR